MPKSTEKHAAICFHTRTYQGTITEWHDDGRVTIDCGGQMMQGHPLNKPSEESGTVIQMS